MPSGASSIIVGGGVAADTPFTVGKIPRITSTTPDAIGDSIMSQSGASGVDVIVVGTDVQPLATETVHLGGGLIVEKNGQSDSTAIGRAAVAGATKQIIIGQGATGAGAGTSAVAIGTSAQVAGSTEVALGANARAVANFTVALGASAQALGTEDVAVGDGATANNTGSTAVGRGAAATGIQATALGRSASATGNGAIAIGAGSTSTGVSSTVIGFACAAGAATQILIGTGGGGQSIGAGSGASILIGGTANISTAHSQVIIIGSGSNSFQGNTCQIGGASTVINTVVMGRGDTHTAAVNVTLRCTNASGTDVSAGNLKIQAPVGTGSAAVDGTITFQTGAPGVSGLGLQALTTQFQVLRSAGGAGAASINISNVTSGAAAAVGTLTNAPVAGNPTFWVPVQINGVVKYIPAW